MFLSVRFSGCIDGLMVVALMQDQNSPSIKTFSIRLEEFGLTTEAVHAEKAARHLGTDHTEMYVTAEDAMAVVPGLASIYDEPFADSSQIPTSIVSGLAPSLSPLPCPVTEETNYLVGTADTTGLIGHGEQFTGFLAVHDVPSLVGSRRFPPWSGLEACVPYPD